VSSFAKKVLLPPNNNHKQRRNSKPFPSYLRI